MCYVVFWELSSLLIHFLCNYEGDKSVDKEKLDFSQWTEEFVKVKTFAL
jgi:hypothetical protein